MPTFRPTLTPMDDTSDEGLARDLRRALRALPDAPAAWQQRAIALFPQPTVMDRVGAALRSVAAVLSFDSWAAPAPAMAMRSAASATRHLLFNAEGHDVDLRIAPAGGGYTLSGQILGPDAGGEVDLVDATGVTRAGAVAFDEQGEFRFEGVDRGVYRMTLRVGGDRIELPPLDVGEPPR